MVDREIPELGVLELAGGVLVGPHGWVVSADGCLVPELSWYGQHVQEMDSEPGRLRLVPLEGTCLSLTSDWSSVNYSHFLLDGLCRLGIFEKAGLRMSDVDHIYCPMSNGNAEEVLLRMGLPVEMLVKPMRGVAVRADRLLAPSFPGLRRNYPAWVVDVLRRALPPKPVSPFRRLYIPRNTTRKVTNIAALMPALEAHGFEVFDPGSRLDSPLRFNEAAVVVGGHGAGLANIAFCQRGTRVLELVPSDHVFPYWYTLSAAAGLEYGYLVGASAKHSSVGAAAFGPSDFTVDSNEFNAALTYVCRGMR